MRIAIVLNTSWNIYNFRLNLVKSLQQEGHEVHAVAPEDEFTPYIIKEGLIYHQVRMDSRGANPIKDFALILELRGIYKRIRPDVILHFTIKPNIYGTLAAASLRIPVINNVCGLGTVFLKKGLISKVAMLLYRLSFRFANKVFFQNADDLDLFIQNRLIKKDQADLVPGSGIDLSHFRPVPRQKGKPFTFLLISRLITDKGILEYVQAVEQLRREGISARFQLLGAMDPKHKRSISKAIIQQWIDSGTIEYLGTTQDVRHFIKEADCVVLPSYREGTPRTLLEAASMGRPMIATDVPGCRQVVEPGRNGLLCKVKSAEDLAEKMRTMVGLSENVLEEFSLNARKKVEQEFDESLVISKYLHTLSFLNNPDADNKNRFRRPY